MDTSLIIVTTSFVFLLLFSITIFAIIISRRVIIQYREKRFRKITNQIEKDILKVIAEKDPKIALLVAQKHQAHYKALVQVLIAYMEMIKGQEQNLLKLIYTQGVKKKLIRAIYSPGQVKRLKAARPFVLFSDSTDTIHIMKLLHDKPLVRLSTINTLARMPNDSALTQIFTAFEDDPNPNQQAYMNVLFSLGHKIEYLIKRYLKRTLPVHKMCLLIELAGSLPLPKLYPELLDHAQDRDKEIRTRVARALGNLNTPLPEVINTLEELAMDDAWEVKAQALKSLGKLKSASALEILAQSLYSPYWYCRLNAGYALAALGDKGIKRLRQIMHQQTDPYAADMSRMILEDIGTYKEAHD